MSNVNDDENDKDQLVDLSQLPNAKGWFQSDIFVLYQGCWFPSRILQNVVAFQQNFQAQDQDIILASNPKSGTTWLKALLFSIVNRNRYSLSDTPLLTSNPHILIPHLEYKIYSDHSVRVDLSNIPSPRLFATHVPFTSLPESIVERSNRCRIVYICRNPLDTIVSFWNFAARREPDRVIKDPEWKIERYMEAFCKGESFFGPFWDHVLGFWKASQEEPEKVLFLKYEDMLEDTSSHVKRLAEFVGFPFSEEEETCGKVEQIVELCSLRNLKELDVNKHGKVVSTTGKVVESNVYFRKGEVGDWTNHLSPSMVENTKKVIEEKLCGSGLTFKYT